MKSFFLIFAAIVVCVFGGSSQLRGQTVDVSAIVQFSNGDNITVTDFSSSVGVQTNEVVNVTIRFASNDVGAVVKVEAPEGGFVSVGNNPVVVGDDARISFAFRASADIGQNSISIQGGAGDLSLRFSVSTQD